MNEKVNSYEGLTYEDFKNRASDPSLSRYQKIGFPDAYREGKELAIFRDIDSKLKLQRKGINILDIGCGCSDLADYLIDNAEQNQQTLIMNDSREMLDLLPSKSFVKIPGKFPDNFSSFDTYKGKLDAVIAYSVMHYITIDSNPYNFIDKVLELLNHGGLFLIGDLQNLTKRNRFFQSKTGIDFHYAYTGNKDIPPPAPATLTDMYEKIDDGLIFGIMQRYRALGFETYLVPQADDLPMANRREDLLILKN